MNGGLPTLVAMQQETRTIPVVFAQVIEVRLRAEKSVRVNRREAEAGRQSHDCSPVNQGVGARQKMIRPPLGSRAKSSMARSNSAASRPPMAMNISDGEARSRMAAIRTM